jgi:DNA-binding FrmR family transcriptional regulator
MTHTVKHKKLLLNRVRRLKGQVEGLERALDSENGCFTILQQISAIRGAINGLMATVIEGHVREHMQPLLEQEEPAATEELIKVLRAYLK